jgi:bifunctional UDP-N-acetylglucosamine pyrophosphorylase/glucosamine-1-phosphate N-acetyltransferase
MTETRAAVAVVLAAGKGVRMKSKLPKVLHELCGRPMLAHVLEAVKSADVRETIVVIGHGAELVKERFADWDAPLRFIIQSERKGTGHAVMMAEEALADFDGEVMVVCGDNPLISTETIRRVVQTHRDDRAAYTVVTAEVPDPFGYGRIVRNAEDSVEEIVEERDADEATKRIREINSGNYLFDARRLFRSLKEIRPDNHQKEYLLTDVVKVLRSGGHTVMSYAASDPAEVLGVNSRAQMAKVSVLMQERIQTALMDAGVTIVDPRSTFIDPRVEAGPDTVILPGCVITGPVKIGGECRVGPFAYLCGNVRLADGETVGAYEMREG